jgi:hypothetical protein
MQFDRSERRLSGLYQLEGKPQWLRIAIVLALPASLTISASCLMKLRSVEDWRERN